MSKLQTKLDALTAKELDLRTKAADAVTKADAVLVEIEALKAEVAAQEAIANVDAGDAVVFAIGRKDERKEVVGRVLAAVETEKGRTLNVFAGEGIEARTYLLKASEVLRVIIPQTEPVASEQPAEDTGE